MWIFGTFGFINGLFSLGTVFFIFKNWELVHIRDLFRVTSVRCAKSCPPCGDNHGAVRRSRSFSSRKRNSSATGLIIEFTGVQVRIGNANRVNDRNVCRGMWNKRERECNETDFYYTILCALFNYTAEMHRKTCHLCVNSSRNPGKEALRAVGAKTRRSDRV